MDDWQLLRRYVEDGAESAFGQLVDRHKRLVYWTCFRDTRDLELAEDAAQAVFIILARKASTLRKGASLSAWLFSVARHTSRNLLASGRRRRQAEELAARTMHSERSANAVWEQAEPLLNDALSSLSDADRSAVLMRHYEERSFAEIASALGTTEEAARKRVSRSLDRLRAFLSKRGVSIASAALAALLVQETAKAVPASVSGKAILAAACAGARNTSTVHSGALLAKKGAYILMDTSIKKAAVAIVVILVAGASITTTLVRLRQASSPAFGSGAAATSQAPASLPGFVSQATFTDVVPRSAGPASAAREEIDQHYTDMANAMQQGGAYTLDFLPERFRHGQTQWGIPPTSGVLGFRIGAKSGQANWALVQHSTTIILRTFAMSGGVVTTTSDMALKVFGPLDRKGRPSGAATQSSDQYQWQKVGGRWVITLWRPLEMGSIMGEGKIPTNSLWDRDHPGM
jgi:RNA polymerase sigma factor (sigma-70 family)